MILSLEVVAFHLAVGRERETGTRRAQRRANREHGRSVLLIYSAGTIYPMIDTDGDGGGL